MVVQYGGKWDGKWMENDGKWFFESLIMIINI